ncbi:unnamed protein product [Diamesa hyperborea]
MFNFTNKISFNGFKLLIPSVGVGNVAQLSADLFIETLKMKKVAMIWHPAVIPIIAPSAFEENEGDSITTAGELFVSEENKLLILQVRSPLTNSFLTSYLDEIVKFIKTEGISQLLVLTSSFAHEISKIGMNPFGYMENSQSLLLNKEAIENSGFSVNPNSSVILGGGYAMNIYNLAGQNEIPCAVMSMAVNEGDNKFEANQLAQRLNKFLKAVPMKSEKEQEAIFKMPISWKFLFGHNVDVSIY